MKKLLALVLTFVLILGCTGKIYAEKFNGTYSTYSEEILAGFDLTKDGTQTFNTVDKDGNEVVVKATKVEKTKIMSGNLGYGWDTWLIEYDSIFNHIEYYIDIYVYASNDLAEIDRIYDASWYIPLYNVDKSDLQILRKLETISRPAQAQLYLELSKLFVGGGSISGWIRTEIKDMHLTVTHNL